MSKLLEKYQKEVRALEDKNQEHVQALEKDDATTEELENRTKELADNNKRLSTVRDLVEQLPKDERGETDPPLTDPESDPAKSSSPGGDTTGENGQPKRVFRSLGDQLLAVRAASTQGGDSGIREQSEKRLLEMRAPSGLNTVVDSEGGYMVETDKSTDLMSRMTNLPGANLISRVDSRPVSANANSVTVRQVAGDSRVIGQMFGGVQVKYKDEAEPPEATKPKYREIGMGLKKLLGLYYATEEELADAALLQAGVDEMFNTVIIQQFDNDIWKGNGVSRPLGVSEQTGDRIVITKEAGQAAATVLAMNIFKMYSRCNPSMRFQAVWLFNVTVEPQLLNLTIGNFPLYIPAGGLANAPQSRILGIPAFPFEFNSPLGTLGDIALCSFRDYFHIRKGAVQRSVSIHVKFLEGETAFRFMIRHNGMPKYVQPLTLADGSTTVSSFVFLEDRV